MPLHIDLENLISWNDASAKNWRDFAIATPDIFTIAVDIGRASNVAQLLQHIFAVELRYAQCLAELPPSTYEELPYDSPQALFDTHQRALDILRKLLADDAYDWTRTIEFQTITAGKLQAPRKAVAIHLLMHSIRHYAQLATLTRTHGYKLPQPGDYLLLEAKPA